MRYAVFILGCLFTVFTTVDSAQQSLAVQVMQVGSAGQTYYQYRVVNNSGKAIIRIIVGREVYDKGNPELASAPSKWDFETGTNPGSLQGPPGWTPKVETTEGTERIELQWTSTNKSNRLPSGGTLYGLNVVLASVDSTYTQSHWNILLDDGSHMSGALEPVTGPFIPGDVDSDGLVKCTDLAVIRASIGKSTGQGQTGIDPRADANRDNLVDDRDLSYVSQRLPAGTRCP